MWMKIGLSEPREHKRVDSRKQFRSAKFPLDVSTIFIESFVRSAAPFALGSSVRGAIVGAAVDSGNICIFILSIFCLSRRIVYLADD